MTKTCKMKACGKELKEVKQKVYKIGKWAQYYTKAYVCTNRDCLLRGLVQIPFEDMQEIKEEEEKKL